VAFQRGVELPHFAPAAEFHMVSGAFCRGVIQRLDARKGFLPAEWLAFAIEADADCLTAF